MTMQFSSIWLIGVLLIATRLSPLVFFSPIFSLSKIPTHISVVMILVASFGIAGIVDFGGVPNIATFPELLVLAASEAAVGLLLAFGVHAAFAVFSFGGRVLDMQMGFGVAATVDPATGNQSPLIGSAILFAAVLLFFLADHHHLFIQAVIYSFKQVPVGSGIMRADGYAVIAQFGLMFTLGLTLVIPIVVTLLLMDLAMALAARSMPQINMFMLSIPIKILMGLFLLVILVPTFVAFFKRVFESIFSYWKAVV